MNSRRMKHRLSAAALLFTLLQFFGTGAAEAQIGHYVVLMPTLISSGDYAGDYDIKGSKIQGDGLVSWGRMTPRSLCEMPVREFSPNAVSDGSDGMFLAYTIEHTDPDNLGDRDIVIRRISSDGTDMWENEETGPVLLLAQSSQYEEHPQIVRVAGGVIVFYEVRYSDEEHRNDVDIAATLVSDEGEILWEGALWVANSRLVEHIAGVTTDTRGNALVLIQQEPEPSSSVGSVDLLLTRVAPDGTTGWGAPVGQNQLVAGSVHDEQHGVVVPDSLGGAFVAYELAYKTGPRSGDVDIIAQHIDAYGKRTWVDPTAPPIVSSNSRAIERSPSLAADSAGIVVSFEMEFVGDSSATGEESGIRMIGTQRLDMLGKATWNEGGRAQILLAKNRVVGNPHTYTDGTGSSFVVMEGLDSVTGDKDVFVQKLSLDGKRLWGKQGYAIPAFNGPMPEKAPVGFADKYGGVIVVALQPTTHQVPNSESKDSTVVAQRVNDRGERVWGSTESNLTVARFEVGDQMPTVVQTR